MNYYSEQQPGANNNSKYTQLVDDTIQNFAALVQISASQANKLAASAHFVDKLHAIQESLAVVPESLYLFLEKLLRERKRGKIFDKDTLLLYITLLCQLNPDSVVPELKKNLYPMEEVLVICKRNGVLEGQAYICEIMDRQVEAFELYLKIFKQSTK